MEQRHRKELLVLPLLAALAVPYAIVCVRYEGWRFLLYLLFWVLLPGRLFTADILRLRLPTRSARLLVSFFMGAALLFAQFYLLYALGLLPLLPFVNPLLCVIAAAFLWRKKAAAVKAKRQTLRAQGVFKALWTLWPFLLLWAVLLWLSLYSVNANVPAIDSVKPPDYDFHVSNLNQFALPDPLSSIRIDGMPFLYHYFQELFLGIGKRIVGGDGWLYGYQFGVLFAPLMLALGFYSLARLVTGDRRVAAFCSLFCLIGGTWSHWYSLWYVHWVTNVNAVAMGCACFAALFHVTLPALQEGVSKRQAAAHLCTAAAFTVVLTGWKGPLGLVWVAALAAYLLVELIRTRKLKAGTMILLLGMAAAFAVVFVKVLAAGKIESQTGLHSFVENLFLTASRGYWAETVYWRLGTGIPARLAAIPVSMLFMFTLFAPVFVFCVRDLFLHLSGRRRMRPELVLASLLVLAGNGAYYLYRMPNWNNGYFSYGVMPFLAMLGVWYWGHIQKQTVKRGLILAAVLLTLHDLPANQRERDIPQPPSVLVAYILGEELPADPSLQAEMGAYTYLKEETPGDCLIATNKLDSKVTANVERRSYSSSYADYGAPVEEGLKRIHEMNALFGPDWTDAEKAAFAREHGIDYLVIYADERFCAVPSDGPDFETIFANDAITLCRVLPAPA